MKLSFPPIVRITATLLRHAFYARVKREGAFARIRYPDYLGRAENSLVELVRPTTLYNAGRDGI